jgi:hypothetical protein
LVTILRKGAKLGRFRNFYVPSDIPSLSAPIKRASNLSESEDLRLFLLSYSTIDAINTIDTIGLSNILVIFNIKVSFILISIFAV